MIDVTTPMTPNTLSRGAVLAGRYIISRVLTGDDVSTVYLARPTHALTQPVVIKAVMPHAFVSGEHRANAAQRFTREVEVLRAVQHPALPVVRDAFSENGRHYVVMSYQPGESLATLLARRRRPFAEADVVGWALEILSALGPLHRHRPPLIYRNLKPASLVLDPSGMLHLHDFGLARYFTPSKRRDTAPIGAEGYAPPEQWDGATDPRADIYALGATMQHLLTNQHPSLRLPTRAVSPSSDRAMSSEVAAIIERAVSPDPEQRWPSAAALEIVLRRHAMALNAQGRRMEALSSCEETPDSVPPGRLVISTAGLSSGREEVLYHLQRLTWLTPSAIQDVLADLPVVLPLYEPFKASFQALRGLGVEVRPVWPLQDWHALDRAEADRLATVGSVTVPDAAACDGGLCQCRHCRFGWMLENLDATPPACCPSCGQAGWDATVLKRCVWCGHEDEVLDNQNACTCCGLAL